MGAVGAVALGLAAQAAAAQVNPAFKCWSRSGVSYSQIPCPGGRPVGTAVSRTQRGGEVPQDRARLARRAVLEPEERQECGALDATLARLKGELDAKGEGATLEDEMPLVHGKRRFRELRC